MYSIEILKFLLCFVNCLGCGRDNTFHLNLAFWKFHIVDFPLDGDGILCLSQGLPYDLTQYLDILSNSFSIQTCGGK